MSAKVRKVCFSASILLFFLPAMMTSQAFNMKKMAQVTNMPGNEYSAVFGYTNPASQEFAIIGSTQAINIYNVTDCSNPVQVLVHQDGHTTSWREFSSYQNYVYSICDGSCSSGLKIINMDNLTVTSQTNVFTKAHTIFIEQSQGRMYIMGSKNASGQDRMLVYTLDTETVNGTTYNGTPANPVLINSFVTTYIHDMYVENNIGYASHIYEYRTRVWNLTNPLAITQLNDYYYDVGKNNHSSWLHADDSTLFETIEVPRNEPITMLRRVSGNASLQFVGSFKEPLEFPIASNNRAHNPHRKDSLLFVSYYEDGVQIFNVNNPASASTIKRVAYYDTYVQNNGSGYPSGFYGCWGVYPFLPSGCILASDIDNGLFTLQLDFPVPDGNSPGKVTLVQNADMFFSSASKGVVLRSPKGYCFRIKVSAIGNISTERIVCHVYNQTSVQLQKNDLAFESATKGVVLKDSGGQCWRLRIGTSGSLFMQSTACAAATPRIEPINHDLVIETYTKGLVVKDDNGICYRVTVDDGGNLQSLALNSCP